MKYHIFEPRRKIGRYDWSSQLNTRRKQFEIKPWKTFRPERRTHDLWDTGAVFYQLSYQANWELVTLWVRNIPVDGEEYKWIYEIYII